MSSSSDLTPAANPVAARLPASADLAEFYTRITGCAPDPTYFGAYAVQPVGSEIYVGLGTGRPGEYDGALLARTDGRSVVSVGALPEQGFIDMQYAGGRLYFPGPDPTEDWTRGNVYSVDLPDGVRQHRTLVNVIHSWGLYKDEAGECLYVAVGQHAGDGQTFFGGIHVSFDEGETWQPVLDPEHKLGRYRTYDVIQFGSDIYATASDYDGPAHLVRSSDLGETWGRLGPEVESRPRLFTNINYLVALKYGRDGLYLVDAAGRSRRALFGDFKVADWAYNYITVDDQGWYYVVAEGGKIMRSRNLRAWTLHATTGLTLNAIAYWPARKSLVVADRGAHASLFTLDPA